MKHRFAKICPNANKLLDSVETLSGFMRRVEKLSTDPAWTSLNWSPDEYKGDALEALVEVLITLSPIDKRINIVEYRPHDNKIDGSDMGIDGYGLSHNGKLHTVQVKYRSNTQKDLTANEDHISNFVAKTTSSPKYKDADMTIFTTAKDLNQKVNEGMYHDRVRVLGFRDLSKLIDNNQPFWRAFRTEMGL
ncbi:MAG: hypothetical protein N2235_05090 [Fischerella sp.]|nr:hypothetical protein [Fischerella sp.]